MASVMPTSPSLWELKMLPSITISPASATLALPSFSGPGAVLKDGATGKETATMSDWELRKIEERIPNVQNELNRAGALG